MVNIFVRSEANQISVQQQGVAWEEKQKCNDPTHPPPPHACTCLYLYNMQAPYSCLYALLHACTCTCKPPPQSSCLYAELQLVIREEGRGGSLHWTEYGLILTQNIHCMRTHTQLKRPCKRKWHHLLDTDTKEEGLRGWWSYQHRDCSWGVVREGRGGA